MEGESVSTDGGVSTPLLAGTTPRNDVHNQVGLDFSKLLQSPRRTRTRTQVQNLMHQTQIPLFMKRECVFWHYRPPTRFSTAALSVFRLHNETVNIWSHAIGAVIMWCLALCFSLSILKPGDLYSIVVHGSITEQSQALMQAGVPIWPLVVFDIVSSVTLILSALAHTFACLPRPASSIFWKLDQLGIAAGILSMYIPGLVYLFHDYPSEVPERYMLDISIIALVCAAAGVASAGVGNPGMKKSVRVAAYICMSACSVVPISHVWNEQTRDPVFRLTVVRYVECVAVAGCGAALYASGVPERLRPGMFDLFGASHQIFHICIVICFVLFHMANVHLWAVLSSDGESAGIQSGDPAPFALFATLWHHR